MTRRRIISGAICASTLIVEPAAAGRGHAPADSAYLHITTPSQYNPSDSISGAVRRGPRGDEVRLPRNLGALRLQLLFHAQKRDGGLLAAL